jgi:hypothetical protein
VSGDRFKGTARKKTMDDGREKRDETAKSIIVLLPIGAVVHFPSVM